jgi:hypothetical protein
MSTVGTLILASFLAASTLLGQTNVVIVSGLSGDQAHRDKFQRWAASFIDAAQERFGIPNERIVYLAESESITPDRIDGKSTKENVERVLTNMALGAAPGESVFILLIGHGSFQGDESRLSLPGPDMSSADFAAILDKFTAQQVALINTASASGDFIKDLSGPNRTIVTATKSPFERNETAFCEYFVEAFARDVADVDKDERISVLEAFEYARHEVERAYEGQGLLLTEHAMLDDNGDGEGSAEPDPNESDGALARQFFLEGGAVAAAAADSTDPRLAALYEEQRGLQQNVAELRTRKEEMDPEAYELELERLLLELARVSQAIRELEGGKEPQ